MKQDKKITDWIKNFLNEEKNKEKAEHHEKLHMHTKAEMRGSRARKIFCKHKKGKK